MDFMLERNCSLVALSFKLLKFCMNNDCFSSCFSSTSFITKSIESWGYHAYGK